jgi:tripartite-type tricarboxylate transporter receptor subunit TctC
MIPMKEGQAKRNHGFFRRSGGIRQWLTGLAAGFGILFSASMAAPDTYPSRAIRLIVPFAAGGANDIVARLLQPGLEKALGQPVVIDNRPAASGTVGTDAVAKAQPDGYTLLMAFTTHTVNAAVNPKLPYNIEKDLAPVILIGKNPLLFIVNKDVPAKTFAEFIALAKTNPGKFNYSTPGASSQAHLLVELWGQLAGIKMLHVPYKGGAPAVLGAVTGEVQVTLMSPLASLAQIQAGMLRPLAVTSLERDRNFPNLPSIAESGFPGFEGVAWAGLFTTGGTPKASIDRINAEVNRILQQPQIAAKLEEQGMIPVGGSPAEFATFVSREIRRWSDAARAAKIRTD